MIKKLRIKFVCVIMAIVTVLLGCILGVVIHFTGRNMEDQSVRMMRSIASGPIQPGKPGGPPAEEVRLPFFAVQIGGRGEMITASGGYFDLSDRDYLQEIINLALLSQDETGELKDYGLRFLKARSPVGLTVVFSDTTTESATMKNLVGSAVLIFLAAILLFLGISIFLSHWAIQPVARAWDQQRRFVADASHELKTPLSVIMANAELTHSEETPEADRRKYAGNILGVTYQMRSLVENMLDMARVDNGIGKLVRLDFSQLVSDAALSVQLLYEERGMGLRCSVTEGIFLRGSEQHLYQVLDVLLDNALKYGTPKGEVSVDLLQSGRSCLLTVESPGEPMSGEELKNIFKRFYRGDKARTMNGSYGLGLAIAESVVEAHKGRIWAESRDGRNAFHVLLPIN